MENFAHNVAIQLMSMILLNQKKAVFKLMGAKILVLGFYVLSARLLK